jgi:hypothetical protein
MEVNAGIGARRGRISSLSLPGSALPSGQHKTVSAGHHSNLAVTLKEPFIAYLIQALAIEKDCIPELRRTGVLVATAK